MTFQIPCHYKLQEALQLPVTPDYIGKGGFKAVYKIKLTDGTEEAIKAVFIPPANTDEECLVREQLMARAQREVEALTTHPSKYLVHIGKILPIVHNLDGHDYLIYSEEFLPGAPLSQWLERKYQPSFEEIVLLFQTLIELISDLLKAGYLHRDIKPDNIMATKILDRPYVLLDLGIAYKMHATELTQGNSPPGTLRYMAPELLKPDYKEKMDFRSDLYAAGLTIYALASGTHPFAPKPESTYATVYRILESTPVPLHALRQDLPEKFCAIIDRCIRKRPALRYANLELLKKELERSIQ